MHLFKLRAEGWQTDIFVLASSAETAIVAWNRFRRSEVTYVERVATSQSEKSVFLSCGSSEKPATEETED